MGSKGRDGVLRQGFPTCTSAQECTGGCVADSCSELRIGRGRRSTGLHRAGHGRRRREVDCAANVGAEMAAEASGDVAAVGARASGRARSETAA